MTSITVGSVVQLNSGGPIMTVTDIQGPSAITSWFAGTEVKYGNFPVAALSRVE